MAYVKFDKEFAAAVKNNLNEINEEISLTLRAISSSFYNKKISLYSGFLKVYDESNELIADYTRNAIKYNAAAGNGGDKARTLGSSVVAKVNQVVNALDKVITLVENFESQTGLSIESDVGDLSSVFQFLAAYGDASSLSALKGSGLFGNASLDGIYDFDESIFDYNELSIWSSFGGFLEEHAGEGELENSIREFFLGKLNGYLDEDGNVVIGDQNLGSLNSLSMATLLQTEAGKQMKDQFEDEYKDKLMQMFFSEGSKEEGMVPFGQSQSNDNDLMSSIATILGISSALAGKINPDTDVGTDNDKKDEDNPRSVVSKIYDAIKGNSDLVADNEKAGFFTSLVEVFDTDLTDNNVMDFMASIGLTDPTNRDNLIGSIGSVIADSSVGQVVGQVAEGVIGVGNKILDNEIDVGGDGKPDLDIDTAGNGNMSSVVGATAGKGNSNALENVTDTVVDVASNAINTVKGVGNSENGAVGGAAGAVGGIVVSKGNKNLEMNTASTKEKMEQARQNNIHEASNGGGQSTSNKGTSSKSNSDNSSTKNNSSLSNNDNNQTSGTTLSQGSGQSSREDVSETVDNSNQNQSVTPKEDKISTSSKLPDLPTIKKPSSGTDTTVGVTDKNVDVPVAGDDKIKASTVVAGAAGIGASTILGGGNDNVSLPSISTDVSVPTVSTPSTINPGVSLPSSSTNVVLGNSGVTNTVPNSGATTFDNAGIMANNTTNANTSTGHTTSDAASTTTHTTASSSSQSETLGKGKSGYGAPSDAKSGSNSKAQSSEAKATSEQQEQKTKVEDFDKKLEVNAPEGVLGDSSYAELIVKNEKEVKIATVTTVSSLAFALALKLTNVIGIVSFILVLLAIILVYTTFRVKKGKERKKLESLIIIEKIKKEEEIKNEAASVEEVTENDTDENEVTEENESEGTESEVTEEETTENTEYSDEVVVTTVEEVGQPEENVIYQEEIVYVDENGNEIEPPIGAEIVSEEVVVEEEIPTTEVEIHEQKEFQSAEEVIYGEIPNESSDK